MLVLALSGCRTVETVRQELVFPPMDAFRPPMAPDLIAEPQTDADLMHNGVQFEFLMYDWQDYAEALEAYIQAIRDVAKDPP